MKYEMTLSKFLKVYFEIPNNKSKYLRHKDFRRLMPNLLCTPIDDNDIKKNVLLNNWICVKDCEGKVSYYKNPMNEHIHFGTFDFESSDEFIMSPIYHRFLNYENIEEYINCVDKELEDIYDKFHNIDELEKWELLELKRMVDKYGKITMEKNYFIINKIKKELSKRRRLDIVKQRIYKLKKQDTYFD